MQHCFLQSLLMMICWAFLTWPAASAIAKGVSLKTVNDSKKSDAPSALSQTERTILSDQAAVIQRLLAESAAFEKTAQWDAASERYQTILAIDPYHKQASKGIRRVEQAKWAAHTERFEAQRRQALNDVSAKWQQPSMPQARIVESRIDTMESAQSRLIAEKLDQLRFACIDWNELDVGEAFRFLSEESRKLDPKKEGVNFVCKLHEEENAPLEPIGLASPQSTQPAKKSSIKTQVSLSLRQVTLRQILDAICRLTGLSARVEDFAVFIFSPDEINDALSTAAFIVDSNFFDATLKPSNASGAWNVRQHLESKGVVFAESATAHYFPNTSKLIVRGSPEMMLMIGRLAAREKKDLPQVEIETRFVEFTEDQLEALRFRWQLIGSSVITPSGGLPLSGYGSVAAETGGLRGIHSDGLTLNSGISEQTIDVQLGRGGRQPSTISLAGLVEGRGAQLLIDMIQSVAGGNLMSAPKITVQKGMKGTVRVVKEFIYPESYEAPRIGSLTSSGTEIVPGNPENFNFNDPKNVGVLMDVEVVDAQPETGLIDLNIENLQLVEFDGFINYGDPVTTLDSNNQKTDLVEGMALQPVFSVRRAQTHIQLRDGQTLVMGGFVREETQNVRDKVPVLGDIPLIGRLFRSNVDQSIKRNLVILTTAHMVRLESTSKRFPPLSNLNSADDLVP